MTTVEMMAMGMLMLAMVDFTRRASRDANRNNNCVVCTVLIAECHKHSIRT